jgi:hypothetical protein
MSLALSCSSSLVLHIFRTRASVSIGLRISPRSFVGALNSLRADGKLHSFWTHDGSIIVKRSENSGFMTVKTKADIQKLGGVFTDEEIVDDYYKKGRFKSF